MISVFEFAYAKCFEPGWVNDIVQRSRTRQDVRTLGTMYDVETRCLGLAAMAELCI